MLSEEKGRWLLCGDDVRDEGGLLTGVAGGKKWAILPNGSWGYGPLGSDIGRTMQAQNTGRYVRAQDEAAVLVAERCPPTEPHPLLLGAVRRPNADGWRGFDLVVCDLRVSLERDADGRWAGTGGACSTTKDTAAMCLDAILGAFGQPRWAGGAGPGMLDHRNQWTRKPEAMEKLEARGRMLRRMIVSLTAQVDTMKDRAELAEWKLDRAQEDLEYLASNHEEVMAKAGKALEEAQDRLDRLTKVAASRMGRLSVSDDTIASLQNRLSSMEASRDHWARRAAELSDAAEIVGGSDV
jgi:hypothetical protein